ncbi:hypothetical protein FE257_002848 [Aspergillus nanangensis]|uniref:Uncharacterized protein n=1 Tax=Aspergillus nanangensis TaxID=2582783 RepID=A0AAD4CSF7_ASPNN|nr:hypothetical protein FE257_002848 [Aspergillus nanangensis]
MHLRFLSVTGAVLLSSCAALSLPRANDIDISPKSSSHSRILSHSREINIPCAECSFADASCSQDVDSNTYLTLSFTTENGTLLANNDAIFPSSLPMQFHAMRHWDSGQQAVLLAYALDARPLPRHQGTLLGDVFLLKVKLFDLHGRPATNYVVSLALAKDPQGDLLISGIQADPVHARHHPHHHYHHHPGAGKTWLSQLGESLEAVKSAAQSCWRGSHARPVETSGSSSSNTHHPHHDWHAEHAGPQLFQAVVLPVLLGLIAGLIACVMGFMIGRTAMLVYHCVRGSSRIHVVPASTVEEGQTSEKEKLMMMTVEEFRHDESKLDN